MYTVLHIVHTNDEDTFGASDLSVNMMYNRPKVISSCSCWLLQTYKFIILASGLLKLILNSNLTTKHENLTYMTYTVD